MLEKKLYKYSGAGNDFIVLLDDGSVDEYRCDETIVSLCDRSSGFLAADGRIGSDGLMILRPASDSDIDFSMEFYNPDGTCGMMCGNGGRCIVAFAEEIGIMPKGADIYRFMAADGLHTGEILSRSGTVKQIKLKMIDAFDMRRALDGVFLNTGTRHFVKFIDDVESLDIASEGPYYRYNEAFAPEGANVNFVSRSEDGTLKIRTWEKGVENETLACGTGITASAIAAWYSGSNEISRVAKLSYSLQARTDELQVEFVPVEGVKLPSSTDTLDSQNHCAAVVAREVYLTGPAELIL